MQFFAAMAALLGIGFALGLGCFLAMKGYYLPLIVIFLTWAFGFVRFGCFPPKDSH